MWTVMQGRMAGEPVTPMEVTRGAVLPDDEWHGVSLSDAVCQSETAGWTYASVQYIEPDRALVCELVVDSEGFGSCAVRLVAASDVVRVLHRAPGAPGVHACVRGAGWARGNHTSEAVDGFYRHVLGGELDASADRSLDALCGSGQALASDAVLRRVAARLERTTRTLVAMVAARSRWN